MANTITTAEVTERLARAGIALERCDEETASLYAMVTPRREVLYIGKKESFSRIRNEKTWADTDHGSEYVSAIIGMMRINHAEHEMFRCASTAVDATRIRTMRKELGWAGPAFDTLEEWLDTDPELTPGLVEKIMIRICVRRGAPIANSQHASMWEGPIGRVHDILALLCVDDGRPVTGG